jgi:hypothetical protein
MASSVDVGRDTPPWKIGSQRLETLKGFAPGDLIAGRRADRMDAFLTSLFCVIDVHLLHKY